MKSVFWNYCNIWGKGTKQAVMGKGELLITVGAEELTRLSISRALNTGLNSLQDSAVGAMAGYSNI